ncbi:MAG: hypothetical protein MI919_09590, partial [Holophagales bacterium]|nr:hypothetical protein [Holophagales bacterium]
IWAPVYLELTDRVRIAGLALDARPGEEAADPDPRAVLSARLSLAARVEGPTPVEVRLRVVPEGFLPAHSPFPRHEVRYRLRPGTQELQVEVPCPGAHLWWPWDRGQPRLYRLHVTVLADGEVMDRASEVIGFRRVELDSATGVFRINGERHFLRGTNYIATQWLSEMSRDRYGDDLALMRRAHINAIRVHAHLGARGLYQEADRRGFLIWQDFPLQWGYEETPELHHAVMTQAREMVRYLYNHPSIVIWSGHNEPPWDSDWMRYKYADYRPGQNKDLDDDLAEVLQEADPTRPVHAVSSTAEHPWLGWYSGSWTDYAGPASVPLITEFGAQALPHLGTLRSFLPAAALWPENDREWEHWTYHNFQPKETFEIAGVEMGSEVRQWIANTQKYQSDLVQLAAESYRRQRFAPVGGIFQFMFVECWPAISWAVVDH